MNASASKTELSLTLNAHDLLATGARLTLEEANLLLPNIALALNRHELITKDFLENLHSCLIFPNLSNFLKGTLMPKIEVITTIKTPTGPGLLLKLGNQYALSTVDRYEELSTPEDHWANFAPIPYNSSKEANWLYQEYTGIFYITDDATALEGNFEDPEGDLSIITYWVIAPRFSFLGEVDYYDLEAAQAFIEDAHPDYEDAALFYSKTINCDISPLQDYKKIYATLNPQAIADEFFFNNHDVPEALKKYIDTSIFLEELIDDGDFYEFTYNNTLYTCTNASE